MVDGSTSTMTSATTLITYRDESVVALHALTDGGMHDVGETGRETLSLTTVVSTPHQLCLPSDVHAPEW